MPAQNPTYKAYEVVHFTKFGAEAHWVYLHTEKKGRPQIEVDRAQVNNTCGFVYIGQAKGAGHPPCTCVWSIGIRDRSSEVSDNILYQSFQHFELPHQESYRKPHLPT